MERAYSDCFPNPREKKVVMDPVVFRILCKAAQRAAVPMLMNIVTLGTNLLVYVKKDKDYTYGPNNQIHR